MEWVGQNVNGVALQNTWVFFIKKNCTEELILSFNILTSTRLKGNTNKKILFNIIFFFLEKIS